MLAQKILKCKVFFKKNRKLFSFSSRKHPFFSLGADVAKVFFEAKGESADGGGVLCADIAQDKIIARPCRFPLETLSVPFPDDKDAARFAVP